MFINVSNIPVRERKLLRKQIKLFIKLAAESEGSNDLHWYILVHRLFVRYHLRFQLSLPVCHISVNFIEHSNELPRISTQGQIDERLVVRQYSVC